MANNFPS